MSNASSHLLVGYLGAFIIHLSSLNSGSFPGGYFMAGMGAQIAFAILIFWFVSKQGQMMMSMAFLNRGGRHETRRWIYQ